MSSFKQTIKALARDFGKFTERAGGIQMRPYQLEPAKAIMDSILSNRGLTFVLVISRQGGKDELLSNLIAYLLKLFAHKEKEIVVANPTYKPQTVKSIMRLENRLNANLLTKAHWKKRADFMRYIGRALVSFLSADGKASVVGATASLLLVINEAQDVDPAVYDKRFAPMAASTNATRLIVGTTWTSKTLLAREMQAALEAQKKDGIKRVFIYDADAVSKVVPSYGDFVKGEVAKLGRQHPLVKTQYYCEEIDELVGMFGARRRALMVGDRPAQAFPTSGMVYAFLIDVGGQDEALLNLEGMGNPGRDYTTLSIVEIDLSSLEMLQAPTFRVVHRLSWQGTDHVTVFGQLKALAASWNPVYLVVDATGVGEGLWAMLFKAFPTKTIPVKFTQQTKSEMGYGFIQVIETGRFRVCAPSRVVDLQYSHCESEVLIGPARTMRWGVKDGTRGPDGELIHDDYVTADSMVSQLDKLAWFVPAETVVIEPERDVIEEMNHAF